MRERETASGQIHGGDRLTKGWKKRDEKERETGRERERNGGTDGGKVRSDAGILQYM